LFSFEVGLIGAFLLDHLIYLVLFFTSDLPCICTGAMAILNYFCTILCILYTYKPFYLITLSIKNRIKIRWVYKQREATLFNTCFILYYDGVYHFIELLQFNEC
jgi:hypothetical protein